MSFALLLLLVTFFTFGCSGKPDLQPTAQVITAEEMIMLSKTAMADLDSFSFELTHDSGSTLLQGGLSLTRATGVVSRTGLALEAEANIGRAFVRIKAVVMDEKTWMTNPLTGTWAEIPPEESPFSFLDPLELVASILGETLSPSHSQQERLVGHVVVDGLIPATTLASLIGAVDVTAAPAVKLHIDPETYLLEKIVITGIAQIQDDDRATRVISLAEFNSTVDVEPPS